MSEETENFDDEDLYIHKVIDVDEGQSPLRIDKFLSIHYKNATRTRIQNAILTDSVKVNDQSVKASYKVKPGDSITISLSEPPKMPSEIIAEDIPLNITYEDDTLLIVNKTPEMVVHPGFNNYSGTLVHALAHHFKSLPTSRNGEMRPGLVHRIDKGTSGLLVIAKTEFAMQHLAKQFFDHSSERTYLALIWGEPEEDSGTIDANIGRSLKDRRVSAVFPEGNFGRRAVTHYKVIERLRYVSLVQCNLETGRTHQIRAHMKHIGHPLFNDTTYGGNQVLRGNVFTKFKQFVENCFEMIPRQALHAMSLGVVHPQTKEWMQFDSELPEDFKSVLEKWRGYLQYN
jgi:23S rRNA pseudouridine1911/1915/1917 synthase